MQYLRLGGTPTVQIGPFVDATDGFTLEAGITMTQAMVRLSKNGGNIAQKTEATNATYDEVGMYSCPLDATDTDTLGRLQLIVADGTVHRAVYHEFMVIPANEYDSLILGSDALEVHTVEITDAIITSAKFGAGAINAAAIADAAIDNATFAADVGSTAYATNILALAVRKVLDELNLDHLAKVATAAADMTTEVVDATILSRVLANGDTSAFVPSTDGLQLIRDKQTDIEADTAVIGALGAGLTAVPWNAAWDAEVQSECADAITAAGLAAVLARTTTVATSDTTTSFTLTAGKATAGAYHGMLITIIDADDSNIETRLIRVYTAGRVVTVDKAFSFTPAVADVVYIHTSYEPLFVENIPEPTGIASLAATPSLAQASVLPYMKIRNKSTETATTRSIFNNAGTEVLDDDAISDDGTTLTKNKLTDA